MLKGCMEKEGLWNWNLGWFLTIITCLLDSFFIRRLRRAVWATTDKIPTTAMKVATISAEKSITWKEQNEQETCISPQQFFASKVRMHIFTLILDTPTPLQKTKWQTKLQQRHLLMCQLQINISLSALQQRSCKCIKTFLQQNASISSINFYLG